jgi:hypothetical protein
MSFLDAEILTLRLCADEEAALTPCPNAFGLPSLFFVEYIFSLISLPASLWCSALSMTSLAACTMAYRLPLFWMRFFSWSAFSACFCYDW